MSAKYYARRRQYRRRVHARFFIIIGVLTAALAIGIFFIVKAASDMPGSAEKPGASAALAPPDTAAVLPEASAVSEEPSVAPEASLPANIVPQAVAGKTDPATFGFETKIMSEGAEVATYQRPDAITFGSGGEYTALEGVITFRGNNYRNAPGWGTAEITEQKLTVVNTKQTGSMGTVKSWGGSGWTGQPLVVKWPDALRGKMTTLKDQFKTKAGFTEVIICSLDGNIYFEELETGEKTRDPIKIGAPTKGTASLDPRGYPIIYVGQGLQADGDPDNSKNMYFRAYSLIDGKKLLEYGAPSKDPFALRGWQAYDSSPLIDAETDTLIQPGENGIIYTLKLNTKYDENAGTVTMDPAKAAVKYRYDSTANKDREKAKNGRYGIENSAVAWRNYLIFTDNAGMLQCIDLNTMTLVYANDMGDDSDVSMVLEEDPGSGAFCLYTGCEYDECVHNAEPGTGKAYARKINGLTGEIMWEKEYTVKSTKDVDGGILASPVLGKEGTSMAGLIIYNVTAEVKGETTTSRLVALDKLTGEERWSYDMDAAGWSPSSPVPVYTADGQGYIIQCDVKGEIALIKADGQTATEVNKLSLAEKDSTGKATVPNNFEATPVVFGNYVVVGSRSRNLFFIKIS